MTREVFFYSLKSRDSQSVQVTSFPLCLQFADNDKRDACYAMFYTSMPDVLQVFQIYRLSIRVSNC